MRAISSPPDVRPTKLSYANRWLHAALAAVLVLALGQPAFAQRVISEPAASRFNVTNDQGSRPAHFEAFVTVMVELADAPAAAVYAASLRQAAANAGVSGVEALDPAARQAAQQTAVGLARGQVQRIESAQQAVLPSLAAASVTGKVYFRVKSAYNGISLPVRRNQVDALRKLPGVKAVHIQSPKYLTAATDIDFLNARSSWTKTNPSNPYGIHGENIKIAVIDTGLDYVHTNFGGPGTPAAYAITKDTDPVPNPYFPTFKVPGGYDFAGDAYDANQPPGTGHDPMPDPNPMDSNGHGTGSASLVGGLGVTSGGSTFVGVYDNTTNIGSLKISPGFAPKAQIYPLRVFGTTGSSNLIVQAIDWAIDPNSDGNIADHVDVISMSLGSDGGVPNDPDAVAASNAAGAGVIVASAAGNAGDSYFIVSSPSVGDNVMSVAASFNDTGGYYYDSNVTVNAPPAIAGTDFSIYGAGGTNVPVGPGGLTGNVVWANPHDGVSGGVPIANLNNAAAVSGNICLIDRGTIGFSAKVDLCQRAGATATIVVQSAGGSGTPNPIPMNLSFAPLTTIPAVMIGRAEGLAMEAQLDPVTGVGPVNVTINNDNGFVSQPSTAADTMASYSARGPRLQDATLKPDITAPAEVVGVAASGTGSKVMSFNGTSSATPHVAGIMGLLRQLHPNWTVTELMALAMNTATHNEWTGPGGTGSQYGTGRVGAGRIDVANAVKANGIAYNQASPGAVNVSFGIVEVGAASTLSLSKNITVANKGSAPITYNVSYVDATPLAGATFTVGTGSPVTVPVGGTATVGVTLDLQGNQLKHVREAAVPLSLPINRQWLTEKTGYAVFTPTSGTEPTLRVALHAAPKPVSAMSSTPSPVILPPGTTNATFTLNLTGTPVNTGVSFPTDIVSIAKPFELQYASPAIGTPSPPTNPNVFKHIGVTSDYSSQATKANTVLMFALEGFGPATTPHYFSSDKEIFFDTNNDGFFDYAVYLGSVANGTSQSNGYAVGTVNLSAGTVLFRFYTDGINPGSYDVNAYSNDLVTLPVLATDIGLITGGTKFTYEVVSFDRSGTLVDDSGPLVYDLAKPGFDGENGLPEPFYYYDIAQGIPIVFDAANVAANGSLGVMMAHMHNATGAHVEAIKVTTAAPPVLQSVVSRKTQGAGTFDLALAPVAANGGVEPRAGPSHSLVFQFDKPVISGNAAVMLGTATAGVPVFNGNEMIVPLTGVTDVQYVRVSVTNVASADGGAGGTGLAQVGVLMGDVTGDRTVQPSDVGIVRSHLLNPLGPSTFLYDISSNGTVDPVDVGLIRSNLLKSLGPPPP